MRIESMLEKGGEKKRLRKLIITIFIVVVVIHLLAGVLAGVFVVARYLLSPPATFEVQKEMSLPAQEREHRMNMSEFDAMAPKPSFNDKLQSLSPSEFALPDVPKIPMDQMLPLDPSEIVSDQVASIVGQGVGSGAGTGGSGGGGTGSGMSFFGIQDTGRSVVIVVDTSNSMFERTRRGQLYKFNFKTIKEQALQLIDKLNINTRFNVVIYEGGSMALTPELMPATDANKAGAREWIDGLSEDPGASIGSRPGRGPKMMEGGGTRLDTAMKQTFKFQPEIIYVITDGEINRGAEKIEEREIMQIVSDLQSGLSEPARIHTILYETSVVRPEEERTIKSLARRNGGKSRTVKAEESE